MEEYHIHRCDTYYGHGLRFGMCQCDIARLYSKKCSVTIAITVSKVYCTDVVWRQV